MIKNILVYYYKQSIHGFLIALGANREQFTDTFNFHKYSKFIFTFLGLFGIFIIALRVDFDIN